MRLGVFVRVIILAVLVVAIVSEEEHDTLKGSPITFQAEVAKMLDILINSLYTNRNIFLRELISNASDALDKIRFVYLTNPREPVADTGEAPAMDIRITIDKGKRQLTMRDGGVGMTKDELGSNLGSLGSSGTKTFLEKVTESNDANFIGQFGVGFYSVFLVSERVRVSSKHDDGDKQWVWESSGDGSYFLYEDVRGNTLGRGTEIVMDLKKDADEFLGHDKIRDIVHRYSEFIHFPIYLEVEKVKRVPKAKSETGEETETSESTQDQASTEEVSDTQDTADAETVSTAEADEEEEVKYMEWELINENKPIWTRKRSEVKEQEYNNFYKSLTKDYEDPMYYTHFAAEGEVEFKSILFIPGRAPYNVFDTSITHANIRLYVRRVFITDEFRDLLPRYLNFIKGVVDSDDLPLNVSREVLQESRILKIIKKKLVRKALMMLNDIAENDKKIDEERSFDVDETPTESREGKRQREVLYPKLWEEFGKNLRLGMIEDGANRVRLTKLLRYRSSRSDDEFISLETYTSRMAPDQKHIYYVTAESLEMIRQMPVLEDAAKRNVEVLLMTDAIDEYVVGHVTDYNSYKLVSLTKDAVKLGNQSKLEKTIEQKRKEKYTPLVKWFKSLLSSRVSRVLICKRHTTDALIVSSPQHGLSPNMARIMKGQTLGDKPVESAEVKRVLEINHLHPLIDEIFKRITVDEKDTVAEDTAMVLFDTAALRNGFEVAEPQVLSQRVGRLLRQTVDIHPEAPLIEEDLSEYGIEDEGEESGDDADIGTASPTEEHTSIPEEAEPVGEFTVPEQPNEDL